MKAEEHDAITTVRGSHKQTLSNIEKLISDDIPLQISCPVMKINQLSYSDVLLWAYSKKVKTNTDCIIMAKSDFDTTNLDNRLSLQETKEFISTMMKSDQDYLNSLKEFYPQYSKNKSNHRPVCGAGTSFLCMKADGRLFPCAGWQSFVVGNAKEQKVKDIWEKSEELKYLRGITIESFPKCIDCENRIYCSLCFVRNYNENQGDMLKISEHFCNVASINQEIISQYLENIK
jgi:radical SAM protein with 4Fe4S-binding SPASM domain